jgi:transposase
MIGFTLTGGQAHESTQFEAVMEAGPLCNTQGEGEQPNWPDKVAADKAYSSKAIRDWCDKRDIESVIPTKLNEERREDFDKESYRNRNIIERAIGWLKECRRVLTRYEKYAVHYTGMINLAIIQGILNRL